MQWPVLLILVSAWFVATPYMGLWHDARLYALEALAVLDPVAYARDLFLAFGSQGRYTLFPQLFATLIHWVGLEPAAYLLTLAGRLLWLWAVIVLARRLAPGKGWLLGLAAALLLPAHYDGLKVLAYAEAFATPRIYAEALALFAIAAWLSTRGLLAVLLLGAALALHPLIALPAAALLAGLFLCEAERGRRWARVLWLGLPVLGALGLGLAGQAPFDGLLARYDPQWWHAIQLRNLHIFLSEWQPDGIGNAVFSLVVLGMAGIRAAMPLRRLARVLLVVALALLLLTWVGSSLLHNVLLTQLQLLRVFWLARLLALLSLGAMLPALWRGDYRDKLLAAALFASALVGGVAAASAALGAVLIWRLMARLPETACQGRFWLGLAGLIPLVAIIDRLATLPLTISAASALLDIHSWRGWIASTLPAGALALLVFLAAQRVGERGQRFLTWGTMATLALSIWAWGAERQNIAHAAGAGDESIKQIQQRIPKGVVVAGDGGVEQAWFAWHRPYYASQLQTAGALFSRDTALEGERRLKAMKEAGLPNSEIRWAQPDLYQAHVDKTSALMLCRDTALDYVLLSGRHDDAEWIPGMKQDWLSLYDCARLRARGAS